MDSVGTFPYTSGEAWQSLAGTSGYVNGTVLPSNFPEEQLGNHSDKAVVLVPCGILVPVRAKREAAEKPFVSILPAHHVEVPPEAAKTFTMRAALSALDGVDAALIVLVRRTYHFASPAMTLREHFERYGAVDKVFAPSSMRCRPHAACSRPASLAFVVMENARGADAAVTAGSEQVIAGRVVCVGYYSRRATPDSQSPSSQGAMSRGDFEYLATDDEWY